MSLFGRICFNWCLGLCRLDESDANWGCICGYAFRYTRLLFGVALGVVLFGEKLTFLMIIGSGLIVVSGIFILWRGKQAKRL